MVKNKILHISIFAIALTFMLPTSITFAQESTAPPVPTLFDSPDAEVTATKIAEPTATDPIEIEVGGPPTVEDIKKTFQNEGFTIVPTNPNSISHRNFIFELQPGDVVKESVTIQNLAPNKVSFLLYGADPTFSVQGTPAYKTRQSNTNAEGNWIKFDQEEILLGPGEEKIVEFTLTVPEDTALGEYRAGIAMEKSKQDSNNPGITIATRILLHADITVTDNPKPIPKVGDAEVQPAQQQSQWQVYYFWISLILFIASFAALILVTFQERHKKEEVQSHKAVPAKKATKKTTAKKPAKKTTKKKSVAKKKSATSKTTRTKSAKKK